MNRNWEAPEEGVGCDSGPTSTLTFTFHQSEAKRRPSSSSRTAPQCVCCEWACLADRCLNAWCRRQVLRRPNGTNHSVQPVSLRHCCPPPPPAGRRRAICDRGTSDVWFFWKCTNLPLNIHIRVDFTVSRLSSFSFLIYCRLKVKIQTCPLYSMTKQYAHFITAVNISHCLLHDTGTARFRGCMTLILKNSWFFSFHFILRICAVFCNELNSKYIMWCHLELLACCIKQTIWRLAVDIGPGLTIQFFVPTGFYCAALSVSHFALSDL